MCACADVGVVGSRAEKPVSRRWSSDSTGVLINVLVAADDDAFGGNSSSTNKSSNKLVRVREELLLGLVDQC